MNWRSFIAAVILAPLLLAPRQQQQPNAPVLHEATHLVHISVIVTDKSGHPVTDLTQNDFIISGKRDHPAYENK